VSGDLIAVDAAGGRGLELADVICDSDPDCVRPLNWLTGALASYPGCAVAALHTGEGSCLVATRTDRPFTLSYFAQNELRLRGAADPSGSGALVCALFVHAWLAAGWPLAALDPRRLTATIHHREIPVNLAAPIPFALYYEDSAPPSASVSEPSPAS
jgi:hypothetical protein